jgi:pimeloyl-ACP methyl ester carboxylesterase
MSSTAETPAGEPRAAGESLWARRAARRARRRSVTRTVVVGRTPLRIAIRPGTGGGPPLLLANGIGASLETFDPLLAALDPAIECIRFDVPGVGGSPLPARPYRFGTLAHLLAGLLDQLGHEQADILGISWGGALAQQFALSESRRCRRVVLVATGTGVLMVPASPWVLATLATPRRYLDPGLAHPARPAAHLPRRARRAGAAPGPAGPADQRVPDRDRARPAVRREVNADATRRRLLRPGAAAR